MNFSWTTGLWKAVRAALLVALAVAVTAGTTDVFFDTLSTGVAPLVPAWLIPIVGAFLAFARNFVKQWLASLPKE